jgi:hypothetical protein
MHLPVLALLLFRLITPQTVSSAPYPKGVHAEEG